MSNPLKNKLGEFKAYLFDLDGTLVDSMGIWRDIDREYLGRFGIALPDGLQTAIEGMSFSETALYFKNTFGLSDDTDTIQADWNAMTYHKYRYEVPFKKGALDFLRNSRERGIKMGIATSNSRELVDALAESLSLYTYCTCVLTAKEVEKGKPAPDIYLALAHRLGAAPGDCLVFEDILPGIAAGKAAGMQVCAVADPHSEPVRCQKMASADYYIEDFRELL